MRTDPIGFMDLMLIAGFYYGGKALFAARAWLERHTKAE
jgi:hypothetical protein